MQDDHGLDFVRRLVRVCGKVIRYAKSAWPCTDRLFRDWLIAPAIVYF
jgi:hypothetical protein